MDYKDFKESTGYGTGGGLCGWNCRHTFIPFNPETMSNNLKDYGLEENKRMYEKHQKTRNCWFCHSVISSRVQVFIFSMRRYHWCAFVPLTNSANGSRMCSLNISEILLIPIDYFLCSLFNSQPVSNNTFVTICPLAELQSLCEA